MRAAERGDDVLEPIRRNDGLDPQLGDVLLPPALADRRLVPSSPRNVPVPAVYQEQRS